MNFKTPQIGEVWQRKGYPSQLICVLAKQKVPDADLHGAPLFDYTILHLNGEWAGRRTRNVPLSAILEHFYYGF